MTAISAHETRAHDAEIDNENTITAEGRLLATIEPATLPEIEALFKSPQYDKNGNGHSNWVWVRLPNGDLMLATFPQGDTYELITQTMIRGRI